MRVAFFLEIGVKPTTGQYLKRTAIILASKQGHRKASVAKFLKSYAMAARGTCRAVPEQVFMHICLGTQEGTLRLP